MSVGPSFRPAGRLAGVLESAGFVCLKLARFVPRNECAGKHAWREEDEAVDLD